jgi:membrane-associated protein
MTTNGIFSLCGTVLCFSKPGARLSRSDYSEQAALSANSFRIILLGQSSLPSIRFVWFNIYIMKETILYLIDVVLHLDRHLAQLSSSMGNWIYVVLFIIIFAETGLIVTPFLPGDSLLFAIGALIAVPDAGLSFPLMFALLLAAAIFGDAVNYSAGRLIGPKVFKSETSRLVNKEHLVRAQKFYEKYGGKAVFLARFAPIIRTFAPFVAGIGKMNYSKFWFYNISGAICWVGSFLIAGYYFGSLPFVKKYFQLVIVGIVFVSLLPIVYEWYKARREASIEQPKSEAD